MKKVVALLMILVLAVSVLPLAAAAAEQEDLKAAIGELPDVETVKAMTLEEQGAVYEQTQAAYDRYMALTEEEKKEIPEAEEKFENLFAHFNTLVMPLEETQAPVAEEKKEGLPWSFTALILAGLVTIFQAKFIHGRR